MEFCRFLEPTAAETAERSAATERVAEVIQAIWPEAAVQVFGSFATGLYLPTSDMDLVVTDSGANPLPLHPQPRSAGCQFEVSVFAMVQAPCFALVVTCSGVSMPPYYKKCPQIIFQ